MRSVSRIRLFPNGNCHAITDAQPTAIRPTSPERPFHFLTEYSQRCAHMRLFATHRVPTCRCARLRRFSIVDVPSRRRVVGMLNPKTRSKR